MGKRRFFDRPSGLTVAKIISLTGAECHDALRTSHLIADVASLDLAGPNDLTFIESGKYADALAVTRAGACLMPQRFESHAPDALIVLRTQEPYRAFVAVHRELYPHPASNLAIRSQRHRAGRHRPSHCAIGERGNG